MRRLVVLGVTFALFSVPMATSGGEEINAAAQAAEVVPGRYVVVMAADPLVTTFGQDGLDTAEARNQGQATSRPDNRRGRQLTAESRRRFLAF